MSLSPPLQQQSLMQQVLQLGAPPNAAAPDGVQPTHCPNVYVFQQTCGQTRHPALYEPGLLVVLSGHKQISVSEHIFNYDITQGLLLTAVYPVLCTAQASAAVPLMGVYIALARSQVAELLSQISRLGKVLSRTDAVQPNSVAGRLGIDSAQSQLGITPFDVTPNVQQAVTHLLAVLADPIAARLFGPERSQALLYALLDQAQLHESVVRWIAQNGSYAQFLKAIRYIQSHLAEALTVQSIARHAGLSESSLNRTFQCFAADSPMQYLKKLRLHQAHIQMQHTQYTVQRAAFDVGYKSASQFSREYKRYFGLSPKKARRSHTP